MSSPVVPPPPSADSPSADRSTADDRPPTWRLIAAIVVGVVAVAVVIVGSIVVRSDAEKAASDPTAPLALGPVPAPGAADPACGDLMRALPDDLAGLPRRTVTGLGTLPAPGSVAATPSDLADLEVGAVAAWGEPAVVLRCGVQTPTELTCTAPVQEVDGVTWLPLTNAADTSGSTTYLLADRSVRVALTVPPTVASGPWQQVSTIVKQTLSEEPICTDGVLRPAAGE